MGLRTPPELDDRMAEAQTGFVRATLFADQPDASYEAAQASLAASWAAANLLVDAYTAQVLQTRLSASAKLPTQLGSVLEGDPKVAPWASSWASTFNSARVGVTWKALAPSEGLYRWDDLDAQLAWCRKNQTPVQAGPLLD